MSGDAFGPSASTTKSSKSCLIKAGLGGCGCVTLFLVAIGLYVVIFIGVKGKDILDRAAEASAREQKASEVAEDYLTHLQEGRTKQARALTEERFRENTSLQRLTRWAQQLRDLNGKKERHAARTSKRQKDLGDDEEPTPVYTAAFDYRKGDEPNNLRCLVELVDPLELDAAKKKSADASFRIISSNCFPVRITSKVEADSNSVSRTQSFERGWIQGAAPDFDEAAANGFVAQFRQDVLAGRDRRARAALAPELAEKVRDGYIDEIAAFIREHELSKPYFREWKEAKSFQIWLDGNVAREQYEVSLVRDDVPKEGIELNLHLTRTWDLNKTHKEREGVFTIDKIFRKETKVVKR